MTGAPLILDYRSPLKQHYFDTGNPIFVWTQIGLCLQNKTDFPDWVREYLDACAKRIIGPDRRPGSDTRAALPYVFGFDRAGSSGHLNALDDMKRHEAFAMEFARRLLNGQSPKSARTDAHNATDPTGDGEETTLRRRLCDFFGVLKAPRDSLGWKRIVIPWLLKHPFYHSVYPLLPNPIELFAYHGPQAGVTIMVVKADTP